jgi:hypothetical protein
VPACPAGSASGGEGGRLPQTGSREGGSQREDDGGLDGRKDDAVRSPGRLRWRGGDNGGPRWLELRRVGREGPTHDGIQGWPPRRCDYGFGSGGGPRWPERGLVGRGGPASDGIHE